MRVTTIIFLVSLALITAGLPATAWDDQSGLRHEVWDSGSGRRVHAGVHRGADGQLWSQELPLVGGFNNILFDRDGHVLVTDRDAAGSNDQFITAYDAATGEFAWTTDVGQTWDFANNGTTCATVALDGTIWAATDDRRIVPIDPADGTVDEARAVPHPGRVGGCNGYRMALLPGDRLAVTSGIDAWHNVVNLTTGTAQRIPADTTEQIDNRLLLSSADGQRLYVVDDDGEDDLRLQSRTLAGGLIDQVTLPGDSLWFEPMETSYVDAQGGIVLRTNTTTIGTDEDGFVSRVLDDGEGRLSVAWTTQAFESAGEDGDPFASAPDRLLPGGPDGELVVANQSNTSEGVIALDLTTGEAVWEADLSDVGGTYRAERAVVDVDGNLLLPLEFGTIPERRGIPYVVIGADGLPVGSGPINEDGTTGTAADLLLAADGTVVMLQAGSPARLVAVSTGPGFTGDEFSFPVSVTPTRVSVGPARLTVSGAALAGAREVVLTRGAQTFRADLSPTSFRPVTFDGMVDTTAGASGTYDVSVVTDSATVVVGQVTVEQPDDKARLDVHVAAPSAIRNGYSRGTGKPATVTVTNSSNRTAIMVPVFIDVGFERDTDRVARVTSPMLVPKADGTVVSADEPVFLQSRDAQRALVYLSEVPAYGSRSIELQLEVGADAPTLDDAPVSALIPSCWYDLLGDAASAAGASFAGDDADPCADLDFLDPGLSDLERVQAIFPEGSRERGLAECLVNISDDQANRVRIQVIVDGELQEIYSGGQMLRDCYDNLVAFTPAGTVDEAADRLFAAARAEAEGRVRDRVKNFLGLTPECAEEDASDTDTGSSIDPNEIVGPAGGGIPDRWITDRDPFDYTIYFENSPDAGFPAQVVRIATTLDTDVDPSTVQLGPVGWGDIVVEPPGDVGSRWTAVRAPAGADFAVGIQGSLSGRQLTWTLTTLDPDTLAPTDDDALGFLPANRTPPEGDGFVTYTVAPRDGVEEGTQIQAQALITFDVNDPIITNTWTNAIDRTPPTSTLTAPSGTVDANVQPISWTAVDGASGVARVIVERRDVGGAWRPLGSVAGEKGTDRVLGLRDQTIDVRIRAVDGAGNIEAPGPQGSWTIAHDAVQRLAGETRTQTAIDIAQTMFDDVPVVVLARRDNYPDSLAGATIAAQLGAPLLLTQTSTLTPEVLAELQRVRADVVVVLGGTAAVSGGAVAQLEGEGFAVTRLAGTNRYGTAAAIASVLPANPERVFLTEGASADPSEGWPTALLAAPWAAQTGEPLLLAEVDRLPDETADAITNSGVSRVTIVGGTDTISEVIADQVATLGVTVDRVEGADRYALSTAVQQAMDAEGVGTPGYTYVATGRDFPDALSVGAAVAATRGRLLLLDGQDGGASTAGLDRIAATEAEIGFLGIAGGPVAVSDAVEAAVRERLGR